MVGVEVEKERGRFVVGLLVGGRGLFNIILDDCIAYTKTQMLSLFGDNCIVRYLGIFRSVVSA